MNAHLFKVRIDVSKLITYLKNTFHFVIYFMVEFLTVSSVNADNREGDIFPSLCGQSVRGAQAHEPLGQLFYSNTVIPLASTLLVLDLMVGSSRRPRVIRD